jgi:FAD dependent monooxygenase
MIPVGGHYNRFGAMLTAAEPSYNYPVSFLERKRFLEILHEKLDSDKFIHTRKEVVAVESAHDRAIVRTSDGAEYTADIVVGADGVHSIVRSEIWRYLVGKNQVGASEKPNDGGFLLQS